MSGRWRDLPAAITEYEAIGAEEEIKFDLWRALMEERPGDHKGDLVDEALGWFDDDRTLPPPGQRLAESDALERPQMLCRSARVQTRVFFSSDASDIDRAKSVCSGCLLRQRCLGAAKRRPKQPGVWGGQVFPMGNRRPPPAPGRLRVVAGPVPSVGTVPAVATEDDHRKAS